MWKSEPCRVSLRVSLLPVHMLMQSAATLSYQLILNQRKEGKKHSEEQLRLKAIK